MKKLAKRLGLVAWYTFWWSLFSVLALAGTGQISVLDSGGTARLYDIITDTTGSGCSSGTPCYMGRVVLNDPTTPANQQAVDATGGARMNLAEINGSNVANSNPLPVLPQPFTAGQWTHFLANAQSTTITTVKSSAGILGGYYCWNPNSSVEYVQFLDATSPTLGTTAPAWSIGIPPTSAANLSFAGGLTFSNAIKVAATTTATGSTAPATALDCNVAYE